MYRPSRLSLVVSALTAAVLLGACSSSVDESSTGGSTADSTTPATDTSPAVADAPTDPAVDTTVAVVTTEPAADAAEPAATGVSSNFCADLKEYQLGSQERVSPVVLGQADEAEYVEWVTGVLDALLSEGPDEAQDFLELQKTVIPTVLEAARNGNVGMVDILEEPEYQAAYGTFAAWVTGNCSQDVVDVLLIGTGGA